MYWLVVRYDLTFSIGIIHCDVNSNTDLLHNSTGLPILLWRGWGFGYLKTVNALVIKWFASLLIELTTSVIFEVLPKL